MEKRHVFYLSDGTGLTAKALGSSLLTQFEQFEFETVTIPYVDDEKKAEQVVERINACFHAHQQQPLLFATFANPKIREIIKNSEGLLLDFMQASIGPLENALGAESSHSMGRTHGVVDYEKYKARIDAVNYTLSTDDGAAVKDYDKADVILCGVSRSGKTPTSLYLALQFGIFAANYPITEEELEHFMLPKPLREHKDKLVGLSIDIERLHAIRTERRPDSRYASVKQCRHEVEAVEKLFLRDNIPFFNSTNLSIEEISTRIMSAKQLVKHLL